MRLTPTVRNWLMAPIAIMLIATVVSAPARGQASLAGSQGTDTSLPLTESAVTVTGRGDFADLEITVNQTKQLTNQVVSITWRGAEPTVAGPGRFAANFLQIFQCWGDDDGTVPENPGPPPEQCVQGAQTATYEGVSGAAFPGGQATTRVISIRGYENFDPTVGHLDPRTGLVWRPFRGVDGSVVNEHVDPTFLPSRPGGNYWLNPFFNIVTTNEISGAVTQRDGRGAELFQVLNGVQSSGLGCGQRVQNVEGEKRVPKCWIVVVPRGSAAKENVGTPFTDRPEAFGVLTSPVAPLSWANRIAIPLEFNPVDSPCALGSVERRIAGNELAAPAVVNWQPTLCAGEGLPPFSYAPVPDVTARGFVANPVAGAAGMAIVQRPLDPSTVSPTRPVVYAPVTVSGITIAFNLERIPQVDAGPDVQALDGVRVRDINLTPRLVAKLLTQSYQRQLDIYALPDRDWLAFNPPDLSKDPDFLQFNPEFSTLQVFEGRTFSGLQLPAGNSDAAEQLWRWVLSDPEAAEWLKGEPDPWGMSVNPAYATDPAVNSTGLAFGTPIPNSFPKADSYCYQAAPLAQTTPPPLCGTDWMPYARSFDESALRARRGFDSARIALNLFAASPSEAWRRTDPQVLGRRAMLSLTDTASASIYGLQVARLSRAGDNGPDRVFIAPDDAGLDAGVREMVPGNVPGILEPSSAGAPDAYPLTAINYAAISPLALDASARSDYAAFLRYAAGPGQAPGLQFGQLPRGFRPLPAELAAQTAAAAETVLNLTAPAAAAPTAPATVAPPATVRPPATRPSGAATTNRRPAAAPTLAAPVTEAPPVTETTEVAESADGPGASEPEGSDVPVATTPSQSPGPVRAAVPVLGAMALGSVLLALELTKRPRRAALSTASGG